MGGMNKHLRKMSLLYVIFYFLLFILRIAFNRRCCSLYTFHYATKQLSHFNGRVSRSFVSLLFNVVVRVIFVALIKSCTHR